MNDQERFGELLSSSRLRLFTLRQFIDELSRQEFSTPGSVDLVALCYRLTYFYEFALSDLEVAYGRYASAGAPKAVLSALNAELVDIVKQLHELSKTTRYAEGARVMTTTTDIPAILDSLAKTIKPTISVIVRPQSAYAYEYREATRQLMKLPTRLLGPTTEGDIPIARETQRWFTVDSLLQGLAAPLGVINYPKIEGQNVLRHAFAVGHELGHFADEVLNIRKTSSVDGQDISAFLEFNRSDIRTLTEAVIAVAQTPDHERSQLRADILKQINGRGLRWLAEIVADIVSATLSGPAAVVSFLWLALGESSLDFSYKEERAGGVGVSYYPWLRLRLRIMLRVLHESGFALVNSEGAVLKRDEWLGGHLPFIHQRLTIAKAIADEKIRQEFEAAVSPPWTAADMRQELDRRRTLESVRIVTNAVTRALPSMFGTSHHTDDLMSHARERLGSITRDGEAVWIYDSEHCLSEVPSLVDSLKRHEMPCQIFGPGGPRPARFPSIVNAGWESWLETEATMTSAKQKHDELIRLNSVLATAIESSQLHRRFALERHRVAS